LVRVGLVTGIASTTSAPTFFHSVLPTWRSAMAIIADSLGTLQGLHTGCYLAAGSVAHTS